MSHEPATPSLYSKVRRLIRSWFSFTFDLTGLAVNEEEIMLDLSAGRG